MCVSVVFSTSTGDSESQCLVSSVLCPSQSHPFSLSISCWALVSPAGALVLSFSEMRGRGEAQLQGVGVRAIWKRSDTRGYTPTIHTLTHISTHKQTHMIIWHAHTRAHSAGDIGRENSEDGSVKSGLGREKVCSRWCRLLS